MPCKELSNTYQVADILLVVTVAPLYIPLDTELGELQTGHGNQCEKLKYSCTALVTAWMGADSAAV